MSTEKPAQQTKWYLLGPKERAALEVLKCGVFSEPSELDAAWIKMSCWLREFKHNIHLVAPGIGDSSVSIEGLSWPEDGVKGVRLLVSKYRGDGEDVHHLRWMNNHGWPVESGPIFNQMEIGEESWVVKFVADTEPTSVNGPGRIGVEEHSALRLAAKKENGYKYPTVMEAAQRRDQSWTFKGGTLNIGWEEGKLAMEHPWFAKKFAVWEAEELKKSLRPKNLKSDNAQVDVNSNVCASAASLSQIVKKVHHKARSKNRI